MSLRGPLALAVSFALCSAMLAGSAAGQASSAALLDCEHLPSAAVTSLPEPFDQVARIECRPTGQFLVQGERWIWRYPASFTTQVYLPAWTPDPSAAAAGSRYFTSANVRVERGERAAALHRRFMEEVSMYMALAGSEAPPTPREVYSLTAMNDLGQAMRVHLVQPDGRSDLVGIVCAPECRDEYSFIATSR